LALSVFLLVFMVTCRPGDVVRDGESSHSTSLPLNPVGKMPSSMTSHVPPEEADPLLQTGSDGLGNPINIKKPRPGPALQQGDHRVTSNASCGVTEADRFDCWPEIWLASQQKCEMRGCCWNPSLDNDVPFCFYPTGKEPCPVLVEYKMKRLRL
jgi:hypothetical protein